jgi:hypothetical protein
MYEQAANKDAVVVIADLSADEQPQWEVEYSPC